MQNGVNGDTLNTQQFLNKENNRMIRKSVSQTERDFPAKQTAAAERKTGSVF